jgi:hypothetical protein
LVADANGPAVGGQVDVPNGAIVTLLAAVPPTGFYYEVFALSIEAPEGTAGSGTLRIQDTYGNFIMGGYQTISAGGVWFYWSGNLLVNAGLQAVNSMGVPAIATAFYRTVPIPP